MLSSDRAFLSPKQNAENLLSFRRLTERRLCERITHLIPTVTREPRLSKLGVKYTSSHLIPDVC